MITQHGKTSLNAAGCGIFEQCLLVKTFNDIFLVVSLFSKHSSVSYVFDKMFLAALAALYLTLVTQWVTATFEF